MSRSSNVVWCGLLRCRQSGRSTYCPQSSLISSWNNRSRWKLTNRFFQLGALVQNLYGSTAQPILHYSPRSPSLAAIKETGQTTVVFMSISTRVLKHWYKCLVRNRASPQSIDIVRRTHSVRLDSTQQAKVGHHSKHHHQDDQNKTSLTFLPSRNIGLISLSFCRIDSYFPQLYELYE